MMIKMNTQYLLFGTAKAPVDDGVSKETYLFGIFESKERAESVKESEYKYSIRQVQYRNPEGLVCKLYIGNYGLTYIDEIEDYEGIEEEEFPDYNPVLYKDLEYFIIEFSNYDDYPVLVTGTTYIE